MLGENQSSSIRQYRLQFLSLPIYDVSSARGDMVGHSVLFFEVIASMQSGVVYISRQVEGDLYSVGPALRTPRHRLVSRIHQKPMSLQMMYTTTSYSRKFRTGNVRSSLYLYCSEQMFHYFRHTYKCTSISDNYLS
jgi:hypothetical protein